MSTILLHRFANREYRLTHQDIFARKPIGGDKYREKESEKYATAVNDCYVLQAELVQGEAVSISEGKLKRHSFGEVDARLGIRALDIIHEFRQNTKGTRKGGWGELSRPTSFTRNARHRLLEAGAIVDTDCGKDAWEITLTLPGSTPEAIRTCAEYSGWLVDRLLREVRRATCKHWFYVWEWQSKGKLHMHFLVAGSEVKTRAIAQSLEYQWFELLLELMDKTGIDLFRRDPKWTWRNKPHKWQSHTAQVYKSVAAYFSKYASKSEDKKSKGFSKYQRFCPSRWWGCSQHIKKRILQTRVKYKIELSKATAKKVEDYLQIWLSDPERIKQYHYEFQLGKTKAGTELGGGGVWVNFYTDCGFARLQQWEQIAWEAVLSIAHTAGEYDYPKESWTDLDHACIPPLYAKMAEYKKQQESIGITDTLPPHPPLSQPPSFASKLRKARGTQPKAALALRALAVQFLAGGGGGPTPEKPNNNLQLSIPGLTTC